MAGKSTGFVSPEAQAKFEAKRDETNEVRSLEYLADAVEAYGLDHVAGLAGIAGSLIAAALHDRKIGPLKGGIMYLVRRGTATKVGNLRGARASAALGGTPQKPAHTGSQAHALAPLPPAKHPKASAGEPGSFTAQVEADVFKTLRGNKGTPLTVAALSRAVGLVEAALQPMLAGMVDRGSLAIVQGKGYGLPRAPDPPTANAAVKAAGDAAKVTVEVKTLRDAMDERMGALERKLDVLIGLAGRILGHVGPTTPAQHGPAL